MRIDLPFDVYLVGGAVRDALLGLPAIDKDYVVVGATPKEMIKAGFRAVGKDFPVFLDPQTQEEYALARTERKSGKGYTGFTMFADPSVTLEEDLARRDLTMNAIAQSKSGEIIDPYGGQADIANKIFRHVSPAFAEDPLRILRLARFSARFADFTIAPETMLLMQHMVAHGEAAHLVTERVWQELSRGLLEAHPWRMFEVLDRTNALGVLLPEVKALQINGTYAQTLNRLQNACKLSPSLSIRFAAICKNITTSKAFCERLKVPTQCKELAVLATTETNNIQDCVKLNATSLLGLFQRCDALRKPARFDEQLTVCQADWQVHSPLPFKSRALLMFTLAAARGVQATDVIGSLMNNTLTPKPQEIANAMNSARTQAIEKILVSFSKLAN